jgi:general nucleoside transport system ATP-binding protein
MSGLGPRLASQPVETQGLSAPPRLEVVAMTKRFGPLTALASVGLTLESGAFHALLGENGAGKSTLVKCMMGYYAADEGTVLLGGVQQTIRSPRDAHAAGMGMVYQQFTLVPSMTVAENLLLARPDLPPVIDWKSENARFEEFITEVPFQIDLAAPVYSLAAGEKQKVEILKQLYLRCRILILDEPTSVLTPTEADEILGLLRNMTRAGQLSVLLITHKFREVMAFAESVTVLRRACVAGTGRVSELTPKDLAKMMIGTSELPTSAQRSQRDEGDVRLSVEGLCAANDKGHRAVDHLFLQVHAGEIVGVAGVSGNGQSELVEVLAGQRESSAGAVFVHGEPYRATRSEMRRHRVFCLPEEPLRNACVPKMSVADNLAGRRFDEPPFTVGKWFLNRPALKRRAAELVDRYRIKTASPLAPASSLSGGNVQRMVLARELSEEAEVLIAANPCFGLDFAATSDIRSQIMQARNRGAAVLLVSEDLDELFELSDTLMVMFNGKLVYRAPRAGADVETMGRHMAGH